MISISKLVATVLMRGHNIMFSLRNKKNYLNYLQYPHLSGALQGSRYEEVSGQFKVNFIYFSI